MDKTLVVWRRLGKEHGEDCGFRVNTEDIINRHIDDKISASNKTPKDEWRWWRINNKLIVETSKVCSDLYHLKTFYYLPDRNWLIVKNFDSENVESEWKWYIHIGNTSFDKERNCWIFTDWFSDVIVKNDDISHSVLDLDELGYALNLGLIDTRQIMKILSSTQELIDIIRNGNFPPKEIEAYVEKDIFDLCKNTEIKLTLSGKIGDK